MASPEQAVPAPQRPPRSWIALLGIASGLSAFGMASVVPSLPLLAETFHADYAQLQWVVSAYLLGLGLAQPVQGFLCDRFGRRPVLLIGFAAFAAASLVASLAPSLIALVVARFAQALGVSVATVASRAMVRDRHDADSAAAALAFITAIMGVAPVVAPLAGGVVVDLFNWRALFIVHFASALALFFWMLVSLAETRPADTRVMSIRSTFGAFGVLLRNRSFSTHTLVYCFMSSASFAFITCGAELFHRLFQMSPAGFGMFWAVLAAAYTLGAGVAGLVTRRFGARQVLIRGAALSLLGGLLFVALAWTNTVSLSGYTVSLVLLILGNGVTSPLALAGAVNDHPQMAGTASGLSSAMAMLMSMLFAIGTGYAFDGSAASVGWILALGAFLSWIAALTTSRRGPRTTTTMREEIERATDTGQF
ncbi:MAG: multidrug effflux MFS transporter [Pseudomonadales bacterium]|nr:multidrug effflux MFS transporter [Pseudomonadales bacterium]